VRVIEKLFLIDTERSDYFIAHQKVILLNSFLILTFFTFFFFTLFNSYITHKYLLATFDGLAALMSVFLFLALRLFEKITLIKYITALFLALGMVMVVLISKGDDLTYLWVLFFPIYAIMVLGSSEGLVASLLFFTLFAFLSINNIGHWIEGSWGLADAVRINFSHFIMIILLYMFELNREMVYKRLEEIRAFDQTQSLLLKELSITDPLTRLYNRRFLDEIFMRVFNTAKRYNYTLVLFILDIDYFKRYNDRYGHQKGDSVLKQIADVLKHSLQRSDDYAFRLGGEEFSGLLLLRDNQNIEALLEHLLGTIEALQILHEDSEVAQIITVSVGAYCVKEYDNENFENIYKMADKALYDAKQNGRNRFVVSHC